VSLEKQLSSTEVKMILNSVADGVFTVDDNFVITYFNKAAGQITGVEPESVIGQPCCRVFRAEICENDCALKQTILTGRPVVNRAVFIRRVDGRRIPISVSTSVLQDATGDIIGGVETFRDLSIVEALRREVERSFRYEDIISGNSKMQNIFSILPDVAVSDSTILIEGESGTGKELMAKAIHNLSNRRRKPLVTVNCGALPDTLLESELFGYKAGAFTDAKKDKPGRFAQAERGTLFLDEIGDLSPALQVRLLRVLQDGSYQPLGGTETLKADVRILAATNKNLTTAMEEGKFREDLYYRIQVFKIVLPPLRERREDIPLLIRHFIDKLNVLKGKDITGLSQEALTAFMRYEWPGNIRELEHAIEHGFILCRNGVIDIKHLPGSLQEHAPKEDDFTRSSSLAEIELRVIKEALARNDNKKAATARELGIDKTTLWRKLKRLGIQ
jgi:PAS domain S-box-containing protein